jgi:hypothetical protein
MIEIRRILCPIDFSEAPRHALEHAVVFAKWYESGITALQVIALSTAAHLRRGIRRGHGAGRAKSQSP